MKKSIKLIAVIYIACNFVSCGNSTDKFSGNDSVNYKNNDTDLIESEVIEDEVVEEDMEKEIESLVLHFDEVRTHFSQQYGNKHIITLHMNGNADIHAEVHYPHGGVIGEPEIYDFQGSWAQRSIKRGANYVDYYDIEFNNGERDLNWCVDDECQSVFFTWDGFQNRDSSVEFNINKVDTIFVQ